jgi:hypothetical protein
MGAKKRRRLNGSVSPGDTVITANDKNQQASDGKEQAG